MTLQTNTICNSKVQIQQIKRRSDLEYREKERAKNRERMRRLRSDPMYRGRQRSCKSSTEEESAGANPRTPFEVIILEKSENISVSDEKSHVQGVVKSVQPSTLVRVSPPGISLAQELAPEVQGPVLTRNGQYSKRNTRRQNDPEYRDRERAKNRERMRKVRASANRSREKVLAYSFDSSDASQVVQAFAVPIDLSLTRDITELLSRSSVELKSEELQRLKREGPLDSEAD
jgi:hypothetical protein